VSWEYLPIGHPITKQSVFINDTNARISSTIRNHTFPIMDKGTITLNAVNVVGNSSISLDFDFSDTILDACRADATIILSPTPSSLTEPNTCTQDEQPLLIAFIIIFGIISLFSIILNYVLCVALCVLCT
jgi:hypothetical protein